MIWGEETRGFSYFGNVPNEDFSLLFEICSAAVV